MPHWRDHFDHWRFTHNNVDGLPAPVLEHLLGLAKKHAPLTVSSWGLPELLVELRRLSTDLLSRFLGPAPDRRDLLAVRVEDVDRLLAHIAIQPETAPADVRAVPSTKLQHNQLSPAAAALLTVGMTRSEVVKTYLRGLADPTRADRIAAAFRAEYGALRSRGLAPDEIFSGLQEFVAGPRTPSPSHQAGALAVLAFLFETCEIFERPLPTVSQATA